MTDLPDKFTRCRWIFGSGFERLQKSKVAVLGAGGVGGLCADALARSGVGQVLLVDRDKFEITNQNRQFYSENLNEEKALVFAKKHENITGICENIDENFLKNFNLREFDVVIDAIDDMEAKILLANRADPKRFFASMGGAKRIDASLVRVANIWDTHADPMARKYRNMLKKSGFKGNFKVVFSIESPVCSVLGSFMGVTAVFGLNLASLAIQKIIKQSL